MESVKSVKSGGPKKLSFQEYMERQRGGLREKLKEDPNFGPKPLTIEEYRARKRPQLPTPSVKPSYPRQRAGKSVARKRRIDELKRLLLISKGTQREEFSKELKEIIAEARKEQKKKKKKN